MSSRENEAQKGARALQADEGTLWPSTGHSAITSQLRAVGARGWYCRPLGTQEHGASGWPRSDSLRDPSQSSLVFVEWGEV